MAQHLDPVAVRDPRTLLRMIGDLLGRADGHRHVGITARQQPRAWPVTFPVGAQLGQQTGREEGVAILPPFALFDAEPQPIPCDIRAPQPDDFTDARARGIRGHQEDAVPRMPRRREQALESVNTAVLRTLNPDDITVDIEQAGEAEMDEMWSFVGKKGNQRWLWHAIDHHTGAVLAYVFGRRKDEVFLQLKALLEPFGLTRFYTDHWGAYTRHLEPEVHSPGKRNTQKIERKHLTLRTRIKRLVRKTICFSKTTQMHDIVIGLFVNRSAFGLLV